MDINLKGKICPYSEKPLLCQEGYCNNCEIYRAGKMKDGDYEVKVFENQRRIANNTIIQDKLLTSFSFYYDTGIDYLKCSPWELKRTGLYCPAGAYLNFN